MSSEQCYRQQENQAPEAEETTEVIKVTENSSYKADNDNRNSDYKYCAKTCHCNTLLFLQVLMGVLCAFKPAEPFVVPYYIDNGISMDQINQVVFPTSGYSNFGFLVVLSMASIVVSHTVLLYLGWAGYVLCYTLLIFVDKLIIAIFDEIFYGLAVASETVYCAAFYYLRNMAVSEATNHLRASTISRTTLLITHVVSDCFGQLMVSFVPKFSKRILFIITDVSVSLSIVPLIGITCRQRHKSIKSINTETPASAKDTNVERMSRKLFLRSLSYVWGGGIATVLPLYIGVFSLSGHTLYQNYITNAAYDVQQGTNDELYGLFVMSGRLSGVVGSVLALLCKKVKHVDVLQLLLLFTLSFLFIAPAFVTRLSWLFVANIAEFAIAELTITVMWAQLAASCQLSIYPAVFLCQALIVAGIVLIVQATVFNDIFNEFTGFTANQTHYIWCAILGFVGVGVSLIVVIVSKFKKKCKKIGKRSTIPEDSDCNASTETNTAANENKPILHHLDQSCEV